MDPRRKSSRFIACIARRLGREQGMVLVVVMMFCMIFLMLGLSLYWLTAGHIRATETERKDVKAFNVSEAGVDAGMLKLKLDWPTTPIAPPFEDSDFLDVDYDLIKTALQTENATLYDPKDATEFLTVALFDNSVYDESEGEYVRVAQPPDGADRVPWDAKLPGETMSDGKMYVEAVSNVQDDRHRIIVLVERETWNMYFPVGTSLFANVLDTSSRLRIVVEDGTPPIYYDVHDVTGKDLDAGAGVIPAPTYSDFSEMITDSLVKALEGVAKQQGTYYEDSGDGSAGDDASDFLTGATGVDPAGSVVYVRSTNTVRVNCSDPVGTKEEPVVVIIDTPGGTENVWDQGGNTEFYGIIVVLGNAELNGSPSVHGALFTQGALDNKGVGSTPEIHYSETVVQNINRIYVLSVHIVGNTWEEYSVPAGE